VNSTIMIILVVIGVLVLALIAFLIIRRQRYVRSLRLRGWTFDSKPALESVLDHHAPPFGLGFVRKVDEAISGTTADGVPFRVFEYASSEGRPRFDDRVASMQLPLSLPDLFISTDEVRSGVQLAPPPRSIRGSRYAQPTLHMPARRCQLVCLTSSPASARPGTGSISASTARSWLRSVLPKTRPATGLP
jgi:hypothetical protein